MRRTHARALAPGFTCYPQTTTNGFGDKIPGVPFTFNGYLVSREQLVKSLDGMERTSKSVVYVDAPTAQLIKEQDAINFGGGAKRTVVRIDIMYAPRMIPDYGILYLD